MLDSTRPAVAPVDSNDYQALVAGAALYLRPEAGVLRLTDADRHDFLHRMTTNQISALQPGQSAVTVLTSPTARILFVFTVVCRADDLLLLPAPGQAQALARHLRGQIFFMDKVKVHDVSGEYTRLRVLGPAATSVLDSLGFAVAGLPDQAVQEQGERLAVVQHSYEVPGVELVMPAAASDETVTALAAAGARRLAGEAAYTARRVELGRPAPGAEAVEEYNPLEVGLGWTCADNKGCYTGQEIIARQITYDKVTRTLVGLAPAQPVPVGAEVLFEGRSMGTVTSSAHSPMIDRPVALAVVKRPANTPGTQVEVAGSPAQVVALPFVQEGTA